MKRLITFVFITLFIGIVVDLSLTQILKSSTNGELGVMKEISEGSINADILVIGSSRALVHFNPEIIESETGMSTYVIGSNGMDFNMQKGLYDFYIEHNAKPKIVVVSLATLDLDFREGPISQFYLTLYDEEEEIKNSLEMYGGYNTAIQLVPMLKYNRQFSEIGRELYSKLMNVDKSFINGYSPQNREWNGVELNSHFINMEVNDYHLDLLSDFVSENKENSLIYFVNTPLYSLDTSQVDYIEYIKNYKLLLQDNVYFDDYNDIISVEKKYFYNSTHLNSEGADLFSEAFSEQLNIIRGENND